MATATQDNLKGVSLNEFRDFLAKLFKGWTEAQIKDFYELMEIYQSDRDPEIIETAVEMLVPETLGSIVLDAKVTRKGAETLDAYQAKIGSIIRARRVEKGWSQQELADRAGVRQSHVSRLETGKHTPTDLTLQKLANALGIKVSLIDPGSE